MPMKSVLGAAAGASSTLLPAGRQRRRLGGKAGAAAEAAAVDGDAAARGADEPAEHARRDRGDPPLVVVLAWSSNLK